MNRFAISVLLSALAIANAQQRVVSVEGIPNATTVQRALERALTSEPRDQRAVASALYDLSHIRTTSPTLAELVLPLLNESNGDLRCAAISALGGMPIAEVVNDLLKILQETNVLARSLAAMSIGLIFSKPDGRVFAASTVPALIEHVNDPATAMRVAVVGALISSGSERSIQPVIDALKDPVNEVRWTAAGGLGPMLRDPGGPWIKKAALPGLIGALNDVDVRVAINSAITLKAYGTTARAALPALRTLASNSEPWAVEIYLATIKAIEGKTK